MRSLIEGARNVLLLGNKIFDNVFGLKETLDGVIEENYLEKSTYPHEHMYF